MSDTTIDQAELDKQQLLKERRRIASKKYYEKTKDVEKVRKQEYRQSEHGKATKAAYYEKNKDRIIARSRQWYQDNKERILSNAKAARATSKAA